MNLRRDAKFIFPICLLMLGIGSTGILMHQAFPSLRPLGVLQSISGDVKIKQRATLIYEQTRPEDAVYKGTFLKTSVGSSAKVVLFSGEHVHLPENSEVYFDNLSDPFQGEFVAVNLEQGKVDIEAGKQDYRAKQGFAHFEGLRRMFAAVSSKQNEEATFKIRVGGITALANTSERQDSIASVRFRVAQSTQPGGPESAFTTEGNSPGFYVNPDTLEQQQESKQQPQAEQTQTAKENAISKGALQTHPLPRATPEAPVKVALRNTPIEDLSVLRNHAKIQETKISLEYLSLSAVISDPRASSTARVIRLPWQADLKEISMVSSRPRQMAGKMLEHKIISDGTTLHADVLLPQVDHSAESVSLAAATEPQSKVAKRVTYDLKISQLSSSYPLFVSLWGELDTPTPQRLLQRSVPPKNQHLVTLEIRNKEGIAAAAKLLHSYAFAQVLNKVPKSKNVITLILKNTPVANLYGLDRANTRVSLLRGSDPSYQILSSPEGPIDLQSLNPKEIIRMRNSASEEVLLLCRPENQSLPMNYFLDAVLKKQSLMDSCTHLVYGTMEFL